MAEKKSTTKSTTTKKTKIPSKPVVSKTKAKSTVQKLSGIATTSKKVVKEKAGNKTNAKSSVKKESEIIKKLLKETPLPFEVGSYIFYPHEGLGHITKLEARPFNNEDTLYYEIIFQSQKMISRIPVKNIKQLKIRKVISKSNAQKVLKTLSMPQKQLDVSWKDRLALYQAILKKGSAIEMATIIASLSVRKKEKPLSFQERQYYDFSLEAVIGEVSIALNIERSQATKKIESALANQTNQE